MEYLNYCIDEYDSFGIGPESGDVGCISKCERSVVPADAEGPPAAASTCASEDTEETVRELHDTLEKSVMLVCVMLELPCCCGD